MVRFGSIGMHVPLLAVVTIELHTQLISETGSNPQEHTPHRCPLLQAEAALEPGNAAKYVMKIPYTYDITAAKVGAGSVEHTAG
jgi:hypothetical protein